MINYLSYKRKFITGQNYVFMKEEKKQPTLEEINRFFDSYQEDLATRELHLKLLVKFTPMDDLDDLLLTLKDSTPDFLKDPK